MKAWKGKYGYIKKMKAASGLLSFLIFMAAAGVYLAGLHFFPGQNTMVGIVTVLICIPGAMALVRFIMFMRFPGGREAVYRQVEASRGAVSVFYDSIITTPDKSYGVNCFIASDGSLLGYTEYDKTDTSKLEKHLRDIFTANKYTGLNIKVFTDMEKFTDRLEALSKRSVGAGDMARDEAILHLIGRLSL